MSHNVPAVYEIRHFAVLSHGELSKTRAISFSRKELALPTGGTVTRGKMMCIHKRHHIPKKRVL
jgi:hypothetical protein